MSILIISENKKGYFDYEIIEKLEAGLVLTGSEVKSLRDRKVQLKDSYVGFRSGEAFLQNCHISEYRASSYNNHHPERARKLLLHAAQLEKLKRTVEEKGLAVIPLKIYFSKGFAKVELGVGRGKKKGDKRQAAKDKDAKREMAKVLKYKDR